MHKYYTFYYCFQLPDWYKIFQIFWGFDTLKCVITNLFPQNNATEEEKNEKKIHIDLKTDLYHFNDQFHATCCFCDTQVQFEYSCGISDENQILTFSLGGIGFGCPLYFETLKVGLRITDHALSQHEVNN